MMGSADHSFTKRTGKECNGTFYYFLSKLLCISEANCGFFSTTLIARYFAVKRACQAMKNLEYDK